MTERVMRDSTSPLAIPVSGTDLVAGYRNGLYAWSQADYDRFPDAGHVYIDVTGADPATAGVLDVETGDATVTSAVSWVKARLALPGLTYPPVVYCNRSTLTPLFNAMSAAGLRVAHDFRLWVATLDGTKTLPDMTGVTAVQWASAMITGGNYDESAVYDDAWHAAAPPPSTEYIVVRLPDGASSKMLSGMTLK